LPKTRFLTHNFGYRYASRSIKGSIDADFSLVFKKTLIKTMIHWVRGQVKVAKNMKTCPHCDVTSRTRQTEKRFFDLN